MTVEKTVLSCAGCVCVVVTVNNRVMVLAGRFWYRVATVVCVVVKLAVIIRVCAGWVSVTVEYSVVVCPGRNVYRVCVDIKLVVTVCICTGIVRVVVEDTVLVTAGRY